MLRRVFQLCLVWVGLAWVLPCPVLGRVVAEAEGPWSTSVILFESSPESKLGDMPINGTGLVAAPDGSLHAFWGVGVPEGKSAIYYSHSDGQTWSEPVDVLVGPNIDRANGDLSAAIDRRGYLYVLWHNGGLYYSRAHLSEAAYPQGWLDPVPIAAEANTSALFIDDDNRLHVAFTEGGSRIAVLYARYDANGRREAGPVRVSDLLSEAAGYPDILVDFDGILHLAWGQFELPSGWPATGVYYANSADGGSTWSWPTQLGSGAQGHPALVQRASGEIHLVSLAGLGEGRYYTWSLDSGQTWQPARPFSPTEISGLNVGFPRFAIDSSQQLFLCMGGGPGGRDDVNCTRWAGTGWESLVPVAQGVFPSLAISGGNRLHLVYTDGDTLFYMQRQTDSLATTLHAVPTAPVESVPRILAIAQLTYGVEVPLDRVSGTTWPIPGPVPTPGPQGAYGRGMKDWMPVAIGILPAFVIVGVVVLLSRRSNRYR